MTYREVREFTTVLQELECPETVDIESFQYPDFPLVARILTWLVSRCDPNFTTPFEIEAEQDRVFFLKAIVDHLNLKYNLVLDPRKLYAADGHAVRELLKVVRLLSNASDVWQKVVALPETTGAQEDAKVKILAKVADFGASRRTRKPGSVTSSDMFHLLRNEPENHMVRTAALNMKLDPIKVEAALSESLSQAESSATEYEQKFKNIEYDKGNLEAKIKKREEEVERLQRRLHTIQKSKPSQMGETEKLEAEVANLYGQYTNRFRSLLGLENHVRKLQILLDDKTTPCQVDESAPTSANTVTPDDGFAEDTDSIQLRHPPSLQVRDGAASNQDQEHEPDSEEDQSPSYNQQRTNSGSATSTGQKKAPQESDDDDF